MSRFWIAMAMYAALGLVAWATLSEKIEINGRAVPMVWIVWLLLGMFAARTYLFAMRVKRQGHDAGGGSNG